MQQSTEILQFKGDGGLAMLVEKDNKESRSRGLQEAWVVVAKQERVMTSRDSSTSEKRELKGLTVVRRDEEEEEGTGEDKSMAAL